MKIGEHYRVKPVFSNDKISSGKKLIGTIVYIHPKGRFATLEFTGPAGSVRECFWPEQLTEKNRVSERSLKKYGRKLYH